MRRLVALIALLLAFAASPAAAQNFICATAPNADSSKRCASTEFVQNAIAFGLINLTIPTLPINSNNGHLANTAYADRAPALKMIDNGSANFVLNLKPADGTTSLVEPYTTGQVIDFTAPICANALTIPPSGNTYLIRDPAGANLLQCTSYTTGNIADLKPGAPYRLRWTPGSPGYWQMLSPPFAGTYSTPSSNPSYFQGGNDDFTLTQSYFHKVFDPYSNGWKTVGFGNVNDYGTMTSTYINGQPGNAMQIGHMYYAYEFIPKGQTLVNGVSDLSNVRLNYSDLFWNGAIDTAQDFNASIVAGVLGVTDIAATNLQTNMGNDTLHFTSVPASFTVGKNLYDTTNPASISSGVKIIAKDATTVQMSAPAAGVVGAASGIMALTGKLEVGQTISGVGALDGTCLTGVVDGNHWAVSLTTAAPLGVMQAATAHYYPGSDGLMQWVDCAGNINTWIGLVNVQQRTLTLQTSAGAASGNTLTFAANGTTTAVLSQLDLVHLPWYVADATAPASITNGTKVTVVGGNTVQISPSLAGAVGLGDTIQFYAPSLNTIWDRDEAVKWGVLPGNNTSSSPWSAVPQQPITMFTRSQTTGGVGGPVTGSVPTGVAMPTEGPASDSYELPGTRSTFISYDWSAVNNVSPRTVITCSTAGAVVTLEVTFTPRQPFPAQAEQVVYYQQRTCAYATAKVDFEGSAAWDYGDGSFLVKTKAHVDIGSATFSMASQQRAKY